MSDLSVIAEEGLDPVLEIVYAMLLVGVVSLSVRLYKVSRLSFVTYPYDIHSCGKFPISSSFWDRWHTNWLCWWRLFFLFPFLSLFIIHTYAHVSLNPPFHPQNSTQVPFWWRPPTTWPWIWNANGLRLSFVKTWHTLICRMYLELPLSCQQMVPNTKREFPKSWEVACNWHALYWYVVSPCTPDPKHPSGRCELTFFLCLSLLIT